MNWLPQLYGCTIMLTKLFIENQMSKRLLILVCMLASSNAWSADWFQILKNSPYKIYVDAESISYEKGIASLWSKVVYKKMQLVDSKTSYNTVVTLYKFNCAEKTMVNIQDTFMSNGVLIEENVKRNRDVVYSYWLPGSVGESLGNIACNPELQMIKR